MWRGFGRGRGLALLVLAALFLPGMAGAEESQKWTLAASAANASDPPNVRPLKIDLSASGLRVAGTTKGGAVFLFGASKETRDLLPSTILHDQLAVDDDGDQEVTF